MNCRTHSFRLFLMATIALAGVCSGEEPAVLPDEGQVANGKYINKFFDLSLQIPEGWAVAGPATKKHIQQAGEAILENDPALKAAAEASKTNTFQLLTVSEFEMGAAVEFNPNLILMAERVSHMPGIKSGKDYLFHLSKTLLRVQLPYKSTNESHLVRFGGEECYRRDFRMDTAQMAANQAYVATRRGDFVLIFILTSQTQDQITKLEEIASSIKFDSQ